MGIKGIYGEIGAGERISFSKLAIERFEQSGRPLRVAVDISIWQFQTQAAQGGSNPAIRTLYYRLLRLMSISVQPLFVFDGPHKPPFKRNKKTSHHGAMLPNLLTKQLLKLFGFPFHVAPGEAEAECALLQREGIVDAVLSEDVDTLMFGCGLTLRNWSSEGSRGKKTPTHVSVYDAIKMKQGRPGFDREGMILIALMSGGDYITEGIPGCGIKLASEAARAGFGKSLCLISRTDTVGLEAWRKNLMSEIQTNESRFFKMKRKTLKIPEEFPNQEVLSYYTNPVVSSPTKLKSLRDSICWDGDVDVPGLRQYVTETFDWTGRVGANKFVRGLAPALLVHKLRLRGDRRESGYGDVVLTAMIEMQLVRAISGKRNHITLDGIPELRVIYRPLDIVGIDLADEPDDSGDYGRDGLAPTSENDQMEISKSYEDILSTTAGSQSKRGSSVYDPTQPDKVWIPETIAKVGIPLKVEDYEESLRSPKKLIKAKAVAERAVAKEKRGMPKGAIEKFVSISKPVRESSPIAASSKSATAPSQELRLVHLAPSLDRSTKMRPAQRKRPSQIAQHSSETSSATAPSNSTDTRNENKAALKETLTATSLPWTLSQGRCSISQSFRRSPRQIQILDLSSNSSATPRHTTPRKPHKISSPPLKTVSDTVSREIVTPLPTKKRDPKTIMQAFAKAPRSDLQTVDRRPLFSPLLDHKARSLSPDNEFPTLDKLCSPLKSHVTSIDSSLQSVVSSSQEHKHRQRPLDVPLVTKVKRIPEGNKYIMLRESLPGGWKVIGEDEYHKEETEQRRKGNAKEKGRKKWRMSQVPILDLTDDLIGYKAD